MLTRQKQDSLTPPLNPPFINLNEDLFTGNSSLAAEIFIADTTANKVKRLVELSKISRHQVNLDNLPKIADALCSYANLAQGDFLLQKKDGFWYNFQEPQQPRQLSSDLIKFLDRTFSFDDQNPFLKITEIPGAYLRELGWAQVSLIETVVYHPLQLGDFTSGFFLAQSSSLTLDINFIDKQILFSFFKNLELGFSGKH